jgi:hypothetical protein
MEKNFLIEGNVCVQSGSEQYDLHNYFSLVDVLVDTYEHSAMLRFKSDDCHAINSNVTLVMIFSCIDYLDISPSVLKGEFMGVEELGYKPPDDFDHDWLVAERKSNKEFHFFIRLIGDEYIRVHAKSAELRIE